MDFAGRLLCKVMKPLKTEEKLAKDERTEQVLNQKQAKKPEASIGPLRAQTSKSPPSNPSGLNACHMTAAYMSVTG
eukprot:symbB.v1.2.003004.t1/scaffold113.1/size324549/2